MSGAGEDAEGAGSYGCRLDQRMAHMLPEGRQRIRDLADELVVGTGDIVPKVKAGMSVLQPRRVLANLSARAVRTSASSSAA